MDESSSIIQLEDVVEKLIHNYQDLQRERDGLVSDLASKGDEINALQGQITQLQSEQENVHGRVSSLLGKLVEWEQGLEPAEQHDDSAQPTAVPAPPAKLFTMEG